jgi:hypothetical protein
MLTLIAGLCCVGFINSIVVVAGAPRQRLALLGPTEQVPTEDGNRILSPKHHALNKRQDDG